MGIETQRENDGQTLVMSIQGFFDFSLHKDFRQAYKGVEGVRRYVIDLSQTEYMDSSALGMLLLLRESASDQGAEVALRNCSREVRKILEIANFQRLFTIEE
ncbi:STAS domain-containing protein [Halorhodospira halophila]|uniref:Anti-sigma factor antagonist n=1 Tax=Halorhodospira halophila (strain DSM 244 / SL1) TaxID=349124 RepID=A1WZ10_HALHL|nr:STAS domain-containing protein [Halorhodospira halophila]ABM62922.1 anti-sigma-factor antagonist [Halorhodospira halophila SL1]MBK1727957.1 anti-sigma factor antagonist [Halorhodospira halophila]